MEPLSELTPHWGAFATWEMWIRLLVQAVLFVSSAFFSGSEVALFALSRVDLRDMRRAGDPSSDAVHALLDQPRRLIISILCGNELVNIAASANMTAIFAQLVGLDAAAWVTTFVMVPLILVLGEVTPKTVAVSNPSRVSARIVAPVLSRWVGIAAPLVGAVRIVADRITTWFVGPEKRPENILKVDEFRTMIDVGESGGELSAVERALIYNLLDAGKTEVVHLLTPRTQAGFLDADRPLPELLERFVELRKKRVPVYRKSRDQIIGQLRVEDVVRARLAGEDGSRLQLDDLLVPIVKSPSTTPVNELLDELQRQDEEAAVIIGEYGETLGVVTITDIVAALWGHIYGEGSPERGATVVVRSDLKLKEFNRQTNLDLRDPRMTTVGGLLMRHLGREVQPGDELVVEGTLFLATEDPAQGIVLEVRPGPKPVEAVEPAEEAEPAEEESD